MKNICDNYPYRKINAGKMFFSCLTHTFLIVSDRMSDDLDEGGRLEDEEEAEDVKVFMFAGFTGPIKAKEKEELIEK